MADTIGPGNWNDPSIWSNGVVPTWDAADPNDQFARIQHAVTVAADIDVGTSPDAVNVWAINVLAGSLTFNDNVIVNLRGGFRVSGSTTSSNTYPVTFGAGVNVTYDMSNATSPSTTWYYMVLGDVDGRYTSFTVNGTAQNKTTFSSTNQWVISDPTATGTARVRQSRCTYDLNHVVFKNLRNDPSQTTNAFYTRGFCAWVQDVPFKLDYCTFDDCDRLMPYNSTGNQGTFDITNTTWKNTTNDSINIRCWLLTAAKTINRCVFDADLYLKLAGMTFTNNVLGNTRVLKQDNSDPSVSDFSYNAWRTRSTFESYFPITVDPSNFYVCNRRNNNKIFGADTAIVSSGVHQLTDSIIEGEPGADSGGEVIAKGSQQLTALRCITLKRTDADDSPGVIHELGGEPATSHRTFKNCTLYGRGANVGHDAQPSSDAVMTGLDNIVWNEGAVSNDQKYVLIDIQGNAANAIGPGAMNYNCHFNILDPYQRSGTDDPYDNPPGQNDIGDVDPGFVDDTRNMLTWGESLGLTNPTHDDVWALLAKINDVDGDPNAIPANLLDWVRAGFATTNTALLGTGSDGSDIGAVPVTSQFNSTVTGSSTAGSDSVTFGWTEVTP